MTNPESLEQKILSAITASDTEQGLEKVRIEALGKKGSISGLMKTLANMTPEERKQMGPAFNALKNTVTRAIVTRKAQLHEQALNNRLAQEKVDISLPVNESVPGQGRLHPVSQVMDEIITLFADLGFGIKEGPDIETDYYNFKALNFPEGHPAREAHDTFYFHEKDDGTRKLLRTHTSPVQIRTMETTAPPLRFIAPGRTFRCDSDQTHTPQFHQLEGLAVDTDLHMGHLKWVLEEFLSAFFETDTMELRFRPSFFPFTEPSMEIDIRYDRRGSDIRIGTGEDWMEVLGCGMVHPDVLKAGGIDPASYQGFAFGVGIDRLAMLKYGIPDLRAFFESDLRWLRHYGFRALDIPSLAGGLSS